jgi:hypothetical protein
MDELISLILHLGQNQQLNQTYLYKVNIEEGFWKVVISQYELYRASKINRFIRIKHILL